MKRKQDVPGVVIKRLPVYLQALSEINPELEPIISSQELAEKTGINSGQLRKDLSYFGVFGKQGVGYRTNILLQGIRRILKLDQEIKVALVGVGNLGRALAHYNFARERQDSAYKLKIVAVFDKDPQKIGQKVDEYDIMPVEEMEEMIRKLRVSLAIIAVPYQEAQKVADIAIKAGIKGILNFAPTRLKVPDNIIVHHTDLAGELQSLAYYS